MPTKPRRILALETSGCLGSAAIGTDTGLIAAATLSGDMKHTSELMPSIEQLLSDQGWPADSITDVFVSIGPGSFTGLRIGVTIARTLAWAAGARIVAVPTVDCLARNGLAANPLPLNLLIVIDAKRSQIYTALFEICGGACKKVIDACLAGPGDFLTRCPKPLAALGEGIPHHRAVLEAGNVTILDPSLWPGRAENVFHLGLERAGAGEFTSAVDLLPLYIRRPEAVERWEKRHTR